MHSEKKKKKTFWPLELVLIVQKLSDITQFL